MIPAMAEPNTSPPTGFWGKLTSYLVTNFTVTLFWVLFFVFNRTTVKGRENVGTETNTLLISNHQSMIDSFLVGLAFYYPRSLVQPHLMPWNPAAVENFYNTPFKAWLARHWKCVPVRRGRRDTQALKRMIQVTHHGVLILFPEGTRTRDGSVGEGKLGAGLVALSTGARIIPVRVEGMRDVLPIGSFIPRVGKHIRVWYGPPIDYEDLKALPRGRETAQVLVDRAMQAVRDLDTRPASPS